MNSKPLQKQYDKLTALERTALLLAANARDDETEIRALFDSAPSDTYRLRHHFGIMDTLTHLALLHHALLLDDAILFLMIFHRDDDDYDTLRTAAYVLCVYIDAWRIFCDNLGIDNNALSASIAPKSMLDHVEQMARVFCPSQAQMDEILQNDFGADARAVTAADIAAKLREGYLDLVKCWV